MVEFNLGDEKQMCVVRTWWIKNWVVENTWGWCIHGVLKAGWCILNGGLKIGCCITNVCAAYMVDYNLSGENSCGWCIHSVLKTLW